MCLYCAPIFDEPESDDRERLFRLLAVADEGEPFPPWATLAPEAEVFRSAETRRSAFRCEASPLAPMTTNEG